jgi:CheY-like chemotaxis protein
VDVDIDADVAAQHLDLIPGRYQRLIVKDTGHGMEREVMERIFDPFFTTKGLGEGTGMGLSMVHGIVKSYNGTILVDSKLGKGTTFQVFFPAIENNNKVKSSFIFPLSRGSERILFIDDEAAMASLGRQMLQQLGYDVVAKTSSIEALEIFRAQPDKFDLVITDMTMPNMTGTDLAQEIVRFRSDIPIILCTGFSELLSEEKAKAIGIRHFVMKPYNRQNLAALIRQALDSK